MNDCYKPIRIFFLPLIVKRLRAFGWGAVEIVIYFLLYYLFSLNEL